MKIRTDFVTNSSSSSFIIRQKNLEKLTQDKYNILKKPYKKAMELGMCEHEWPDSWNLVEHNGNLIGWVISDNFDWITFMSKVGIDKELIEYQPENMGAGAWGMSLIEDYEKENNCNLTGWIFEADSDLVGENWLEPLTDEEYFEIRKIINDEITELIDEI